MFGVSEYPGVLLLSAKMSASVEALGWDMAKMSRSRRPRKRAARFQKAQH